MFITHRKPSQNNFRDNVLALRQKSETSRLGMKWDEEEDVNLMIEVTQNMGIDEIANIHKRTISAIKIRIMQHASKLIESGKSTKDVSEMFHMPSYEITEFMKKQTTKQTNKQLANTDKYMDILVEIRDLLLKQNTLHH